MAKLKSVADHFMEAAAGLLDGGSYDSLHAEAVRRSREETISSLGHLPKAQTAAEDDHGSGNRPPKAAPLNVIAIERPHAAQRLEERFGFKFGDGDLQSIREIVKAGKGFQTVRKQMRLIETIDMAYKGVAVRAVWDATTEHLITAYPKKGKKQKGSHPKAPGGPHRRKQSKRDLMDMAREDACV